MPNRLKRWLPDNRENKILLLRHGAVQTASPEKWFIGQTDLPLSARGEQQAHYWREWLSEVPLSGIFCSDLRRCMDTAGIIAAEHANDITVMAGLREIHLGQWDGISFGRVKRHWPDAFRQRGKAFARFRPPGGENFMDLHKRAIPAFEQAVGQAGGNALIVAHAGVNRMILCHLLGMPPENLFHIAQGQAAMNLIERRTAGYRIQALNLLPVIPTGIAAER